MREGWPMGPLRVFSRMFLDHLVELNRAFIYGEMCEEGYVRRTQWARDDIERISLLLMSTRP